MIPYLKCDNWPGTAPMKCCAIHLVFLCTARNQQYDDNTPGTLLVFFYHIKDMASFQVHRVSKFYREVISKNLQYPVLSTTYIFKVFR